MTRPTVYSSIQTHPSLLLPTPLPSSAPFLGGGNFLVRGQRTNRGIVRQLITGTLLLLKLYLYSKSTTNLRLIAQMEFEFIRLS